MVCKALRLLFCVCAAIVAARPAAFALDLTALTGRAALSGHMEVLRDETARLGIEQVLTSQEFRPLPGDLVAGYTTSAFWLRVPVRRPADAGPDWWLEVEMPFLDHVDLYRTDGKTVESHLQLGDRHPLAERPIRDRNLIFPVFLADTKARWLYLRVQSTSTTTVLATLWTPDAFVAAASTASALLGMLHGVTIVIVLSALIQFLVTRQRVYGALALFGTCFEAAACGNNGYTSLFFPTLPLVADSLMGISSCLMLASGALLSSELMGIKSRHPRIHRSYRLVAVLGLAGAVTPLFDAYRPVGGAINAAALYVCAMQILIGIGGVIRRDRESMLVLAAFGGVLLSYILFAFRNLGIDLVSAQLHYGPQVGAAFLMIMVSVAVAQRAAVAERAQHAAQQALLTETRRHHGELEQRVLDRTEELRAQINERRMAEERLRNSENRLRAMLDAAPFPMVVTAISDGRILFVNNPGRSLLGLSPDDDLTGRSIVGFYGNPGQRKDILARIEATGAVAGEEMLIRRSDGQGRWLLMSAVRFHYSGDDAIMSCASDITARKELEGTLLAAQERLESGMAVQQQAMREQRNFVAMVSHEFRTPLAVIGAASEFLEITPAGRDPVAKTEITKIRRAVLRLSGLMENCLAEEWLDTTLDGGNAVPVNLNALLAELRDEHGGLAASRLSLSLPERRLMVSGSPQLLRVLFSNLIENAVKYSAPDGDVRITLARSADWAEATIADNGPGIPRAEADLIFDKYYRSPTAHNRSGTGLGLHLVRRIAELHHAQVALLPSDGPGAEFRVRLSLINDPSPTRPRT